jgi:hypothetical protein
MGLACEPNDSRALYVTRVPSAGEGNKQKQNIVLSFISFDSKVVTGDLTAVEVLTLWSHRRQ